MRRIRIGNVLPDSIAQELGIKSGDYLLKINGETIKDIFDYRYLIADENILVEVQADEGQICEFDIEKEEYEDLGLEFEEELIEKAKSCSNSCVFCFIDQLPIGMRKTLYFKDDDSRLSFLTGNYVTLTNISDADIKRIIRYRMSPINISVHTVDSELRVTMLKNNKAGNILERISMLTDAGIEVNCQIVLCKGINDDQYLDESIRTLGDFYPGVRSVSVVPVGLTKHREKLFQLKSFDEESSKAVIEQVLIWQDLFLKKHGSRIVYLADEFYIKAGIPIPSFDEYEDFPQIENGVGLIASFEKEFYDYLNVLSGSKSNKVKLSDEDKAYHQVIEGKLSVVTGFGALKFIEKAVSYLKESFSGLSINVYAIKNDFFGELVTVAGLITGHDIINQLKGKDIGTRLLIARCMLKANTELFLDDYTISDIEKKLGVEVVVVENSGIDFINKILRN